MSILELTGTSIIIGKHLNDNAFLSGGFCNLEMNCESAENVIGEQYKSSHGSS